MTMKRKRLPLTYFAPSYYSEFVCIADRCRHSCCVDWEICIDRATLRKYRRIPAILQTVTKGEAGASFALSADGRCPHLNADGLCSIILSHGEGYLSDICRAHPRFYNHVGGGRIEAGLGLVCEEACRLILSCDAPFPLAEIAPPDGASPDTAGGERAFDPLPARDRMLAVTMAQDAGYDRRSASLKAEFNLPALSPPAAWLDRYLSLEILDGDWEKTLQAAKGAVPRAEPDGALDAHYARLLAYFIYRHVSTAAHPDDLRARLAFALLSVDMIRHLLRCGGRFDLAALADLARRYSAEIEYAEDNTDELIFACAAAPSPLARKEST